MSNQQSHKTFVNQISRAIKAATILSLVLVFSLSFFEQTHAATLSFSPSSMEIAAGHDMVVHILVGTNGKSINNAEAVIHFPSDLLEVVSVDKGASIFSMWVDDPKFSNSDGTITFNGGLPNPGFVGENGEIITIDFLAKKQGMAPITFSDTAVRQNDGLGTDILTAQNAGSIDITAPVVPVVSPIEKTPTPSVTPLIKIEPSVTPVVSVSPVVVTTPVPVPENKFNLLPLVLFILALLALASIAVIHLATNVPKNKNRNKSLSANDSDLYRRAFEVLSKRVKDQISFLNDLETRRPLTKEEVKVLLQLTESLFNAKECLSKKNSNNDDKIKP